jgi:hypothetical protein
MTVARATLIGLSTYTSSRYTERAHPKLPKESPEAYDARIWREKAYYDPDTLNVCIPAMAFKMALDSVAKRNGKQIPGKGKSTYTKHFLSGVLVFDDAPLGISRDETEMKEIYANADGVRGSGKRVWRRFPCVPPGWRTEVEFNVVDPVLTREVFEEHLDEAGKFIGVGQFRPQNGGYNGRWRVESINWS